LNGYPLNITPLISMIPGPAYVTRQSVDTAAAVRKAKKAIRKAFENSLKGLGTSVVEVVSTCSSGWKLTPGKANEWMREHMVEAYPLGDLKDASKDLPKNQKK
ncbi:MAG: 2-oxoglutarate oxidoreductase, partial [Duncaniella sp.]|nr:2-oxoglutarate oxidoreductase [Duncaniella sp.]